MWWHWASMCSDKSAEIWIWIWIKWRSCFGKYIRNCFDIWQQTHTWVFPANMYHLTLLVLKLEYSGINWSIPWLLMTWLLVSPGHQHPWYWKCRIIMSLSSMRKDFNKSVPWMPSQCWEITENGKIFSCLVKIKLTREGLKLCFHHSQWLQLS